MGGGGRIDEEGSRGKGTRAEICVLLCFLFRVLYLRVLFVVFFFLRDFCV